MATCLILCSEKSPVIRDQSPAIGFFYEITKKKMSNVRGSLTRQLCITALALQSQQEFCHISVLPFSKFVC
jgi:hypothetical protein